jgi:V/A-type H+-transporting ATPase subunit B
VSGAGATPPLVRREYRTVTGVAGPLLFFEHGGRATVGELVRITPPAGPPRRGQVLEVSERHAVVQVFEETSGLDAERTRVLLTADVARADLSPHLLGRVFNGAGEPLDGGPPVVPERRADVNGAPLNPAAREKPADFIQTGISTIDGLATLVRGQKLPIFSGAGLPANELAAQIVRQARVPGGGGFAVVFAAMGITFRDASFFLRSFEDSGALDRTVIYLNRADDPTVERILTPRYALTAAEYLAFERGLDVLVVLTDMTSYCEAVREVATAREEVPGRRGYPGYLYSDLATIYERAGRVKGRRGSVTQIPVLTMPDDDVTHPVPDLTGYITEGQIVLSRALHRKGVYPPVDVLPSLSRLMNLGIGEGRTREDHKGVSDQLYAVYAQGRDLKRLEAIVGEAGLSELDRKYLAAAELFERRFVGQGLAERTMAETLDVGWQVLSTLPAEELVRIRAGILQKYYRRVEDEILERGERRESVFPEG